MCDFCNRRGKRNVPFKGGGVGGGERGGGGAAQIQAGVSRLVRTWLNGGGFPHGAHLRAAQAAVLPATEPALVGVIVTF